jgi:hypothetical protein
VLGCACEVFLRETPQPARSSVNAARNINRLFDSLLPRKRTKKRASGETNARSILDGMGIHALLFVVPTVILVL